MFGARAWHENCFSHEKHWFDGIILFIIRCDAEQFVSGVNFVINFGFDEVLCADYAIQQVRAVEKPIRRI